MLVKEVNFCLKKFLTCSKTVACMASVRKSEGGRGKMSVVKNAKSEILHCLLLVEKICLPMHVVNKSGSFTRYGLTEEWVVGGIHLHFRNTKNKFPLHWTNICFQRSMVHLIMPSRDNL